ncbi:MAG: hypothetical protein JWQ81_2539 [Amycolatopsis sp.]|nr:hypothetical protein [Amycolatopsis sp.]
MVQHNLFGIGGVAMEDCARSIGALFEIELSQRESDYLGCYMIGAGADFKVKLVEQSDPEGELIESEYPDLGILIYLDGESDFPQVDGHEVSGVRIVGISGS